MNRLPALTLWCLPAALALAGCQTTTDTFPSLAIRDSERVGGTIAVPSAPPPAPAPAVTADLQRLLAGIREGHARFTGSTGPARQRVAAARGDAARGDAMGSDAWSAAQVAVADLESQRSQVMIALADLDRIYVDAVVEGADAASLEAALTEANQLVEQENATIAELLGALAN